MKTIVALEIFTAALITLCVIMSTQNILFGIVTYFLATAVMKIFFNRTFIKNKILKKKEV